MQYPDLNSYIGSSSYFIWKEALWLPKWGRAATEDDGLNSDILEAIINFTENYLDPLRDYLNVPFVVHCWYRPPEYNMFVAGAGRSPHQSLTSIGNGMYCSAIDFHPVFENMTEIESCIKGTKTINSILCEYSLRMENLGSSPVWIHIDNVPTQNAFRFFIP